MKKWFGLLMTVVMMLCMVAPSFAATNTAARQVVEDGDTWYYNAAGAKVDDTTFPGGDAVVKLSKTVASTGTENEFEVTLQVSTTQNILELHSDTPDAAVMLILDVSNSMDDCDTCGKEATEHKTHGQNASQCTYVSRLAKAKAAAIQFLDDFANETGVEEGDKRWVAIVDFGSTAMRRLNWVDVTDPVQLAAAKAVINSLTVAHSGVQGVDDAGGTNIEGALMLGANVWEDNATVKALDYKYTIFLTDGQPTYHVEGSSSSTEKIGGTRGGGNTTTLNDAKDVGTQANRILNLGGLSRLYSICYGSVKSGQGPNATYTYVANTKPFGNWNSANPATRNDMTILEWLEAFSTKAYNGSAAEVNGLFDTFNSIISQIQLAAQAWKVEDTMGTHVVYGSEVKQNNIKNSSSFANNVLNWDILASDYSSYETTTVGNNEYGILTYTYKYTVTLDNLDTTYTGGTEADVNTEATLTYAVKANDGLWTVVNPVAFPVPTVKGYTGTLTFTKGWKESDTFKPLAGVVFTLTSNEKSAEGTTWTATATSGADGTVEFTGIPSGHTYTLVETSIPTVDGKQFANMEPKTVTVSWGDAACAGLNAAGQIINEAKDKTVSLTLKKAFGTNNAYTPEEIKLTLTAPDGATGDVVLNSANKWTVTLDGLAPGQYTIYEDAEVDGYTLVKSATLAENGATTTITPTYGNWKVTLNVEGQESHQDFTVTVTNTYTKKVGNVSVEKTFWERDHDDLISGNTDPKLEELAATLYEHITVTVTLAGPETRTITLNSNNNWKGSAANLPVGEYTVTETVNGKIVDRDFVHMIIKQNGTTISGNKITVTENTTLSLAMENHYTHHMGDIRVEKLFDGIEADNAALDNVTFYVDVKDASGNVVDTIAVKRLVSDDNEWVGTSKDLPVGQYTLEEKVPAAIAGYDFISDVFNLTNNIVTVQKETTTSTTTVVVTNTYVQQKGTLTVKKNFVLPEGDTTFSYPAYITVNVLDGLQSGNVVETLTLTGNTTPAWTASVELPLGKYYLAEVLGVGLAGSADVDGYGVTATWSDDGVVVIEAPENGVAKTYTATVTNTYTRDKGSVTISKDFAGVPDDRTNVALEFVIYKMEGNTPKRVGLISLPDSDDNNPWSETIDLPTGTYYLYEYGARDDFANHTLTKVEFTQGNQTTTWYDSTIHTDMSAITGYEFTVTDGGTISISAKNTYTKDTGSLTIKKAFVGLTDAEKENLAIKVSVMNGDMKVETVDLDKTNNWSATVDNLDAGVTYTLVEDRDSAAVSGYNLAVDWDKASVEIVKGQTATATVTNTYTKQTGTLELRKIFNGILAEDQKLLDTVKIIVVVADPKKVNPLQTITLSKANGWKASVSLPVGTYTIEEKVIDGMDDYNHTDVTFVVTGSNFTTDVRKGEDGKLGHIYCNDVEVTNKATVAVQLTNVMERQTGSLTITKVFAEDSVLKADDYFAHGVSIDVLVKKDGSTYKTVTLPVTNDAGEKVWSVTLTDVPTGTYTVEEVTTAGATNSAYINNYGLHVTYTNNGTVTVTENGTATMTVTNKYTSDVGYLKVHKDFADNDASKAAEKAIPDSGITIEVYEGNTLVTKGNVSRTNGGTVTFKLPAGTYTVKEIVDQGAEGTAYVDGYVLTHSWDNATVTVVKGTTVTATVTNNYGTVVQTGSLTVTKEFSGLPDNVRPAQIQFTVQMGDGAIQTVILPDKDDTPWSVTLANLPTGTYTVKEVLQTANVDGYTLTAQEEQTVTVTANATTAASVTFTNTYTPVPTTGKLTITKAFAPTSALNGNHFDSIKVYVMNGATEVAEVTLLKSENWTKTIEVPFGTYTVVEDSASASAPGYGWSVSYDKPSVTVSATSGDAVTVTNHYTYIPVTGSLKLTKAFHGPANLYPDSVEFTVTGPGYSQKVTLNAQNSWTAILGGLLPGEYTVTENLENGSSYFVSTSWSSPDGKINVYAGQLSTLACTNVYQARETLTVRIPVEKTVILAGPTSGESYHFSFQAAWQGSGVAVRFENDPANTAGSFYPTSANSYGVTIKGDGTVKGYIVLQGYAEDLLSFKLQTWEQLTGYASAEEAVAAGWTFDKTATDGSIVWNINLGHDGQGGLQAAATRTDGQSVNQVNYVNAYTTPYIPPETGDSENILLWAALCSISALSVMVLLKRRKSAAAMK